MEDEVEERCKYSYNDRPTDGRRMIRAIVGCNGESKIRSGRSEQRQISENEWRESEQISTEIDVLMPNRGRLA